MLTQGFLMFSAVLFTPIIAFFFFKYIISKNKTAKVEGGMSVLEPRVQPFLH